MASSIVINEHLDRKYAEIISFIKNNSSYTTKDAIITSIRNIIKKVMNERKIVMNERKKVMKESNDDTPLYINLCTTKIGSEQWMYLTIKDLLPEHHVVLVDDNRFILSSLENDVDILYVDDMILSGGNCSDVTYFLFKDQQIKASINYIICSSILTDKGATSITNEINTYVPYIKHRYVSGNTCLSLTQAMGKCGVQYDSTLLQDFYRDISPDTYEEAHLFYTDYKLPSSMSSYPDIYKHMMVVNRDFMQEVEEQWQILFQKIEKYSKTYEFKLSTIQDYIKRSNMQYQQYLKSQQI